MKTVKLPAPKATPREFYDARLHEMLTYMRPHDTAMELDWADKFIGPYEPLVTGADMDNIAAYVVSVPCADGSASRVLFSAHVDTVHRQPGRQKVKYRPSNNRYYKDDGQPLGADDGAGVWMLLELMDAKVPGTYVFHRGEECGGIGSKWLTEKHHDWAEYFDYAVAFDRKATDSIITHQGWGRCCSDDFAAALGDALNASCEDFMYSADDTGVYTDTAEYVDAIGECTNISVGYYSEHTKNEELDLRHLFALRDAAVKLDWAALPVVRKKGEIEKKEFPKYGGSMWGTGKGGYIPAYDENTDLLSLEYAELYEFAADDTDMFLEALFNQWPAMNINLPQPMHKETAFKTIAEEIAEIRAMEESGRMPFPH